MRPFSFLFCFCFYTTTTWHGSRRYTLGFYEWRTTAQGTITSRHGQGAHTHGYLLLGYICDLLIPRERRDGLESGN